MKATGIVRRIDELGRIVIPKEIRRTLGLREGDAVELYLDSGGVCLVPYTVGGCYKEKIEHLLHELKEEESNLNNKQLIISSLEIAKELLKEGKTNE